MDIFCLSVLPSAFPDLTCWLTRILLWSFAGTSSKDRTWDELSLYEAGISSIFYRNFCKTQFFQSESLLQPCSLPRFLSLSSVLEEAAGPFAYNQVFYQVKGYR